MINSSYECTILYPRVMFGVSYNKFVLCNLKNDIYSERFHIRPSFWIHNFASSELISHGLRYAPLRILSNPFLIKFGDFRRYFFYILANIRHLRSAILHIRIESYFFSDEHH